MIVELLSCPGEFFAVDTRWGRIIEEGDRGCDGGCAGMEGSGGGFKEEVIGGCGRGAEAGGVGEEETGFEETGDAFFGRGSCDWGGEIDVVVTRGLLFRG